MRIVYDTNILVLSQIGNPALAILQAAFTDATEKPLAFYYSEAMLTEYTNTLTKLTRERFDLFDPVDINELLEQVKRYGHLVHPTITLTGNPDACSHEPDNRFLECAITTEADYIITVNTVHFPTIYQGIKVIGPTQFSHILFSD